MGWKNKNRLEKKDGRSERRNIFGEEIYHLFLGRMEKRAKVFEEGKKLYPVSLKSKVQCKVPLFG